MTRGTFNTHNIRFQSPDNDTCNFCDKTEVFGTTKRRGNKTTRIEKDIIFDCLSSSESTKIY